MPSPDAGKYVSIPYQIGAGCYSGKRIWERDPLVSIPYQIGAGCYALCPENGRASVSIPYQIGAGCYIKKEESVRVLSINPLPNRGRLLHRSRGNPVSFSYQSPTKSGQVVTRFSYDNIMRFDVSIPYQIGAGCYSLLARIQRHNKYQSPTKSGQVVTTSS